MREGCHCKATERNTGRWKKNDNRGLETITRALCALGNRRFLVIQSKINGKQAIKSESGANRPLISKGKNNLSAVNETANSFCVSRKPSLTAFFHISKPIHHNKIELNDEGIMLASLCLPERLNYVSVVDKLFGKGATF